MGRNKRQPKWLYETLPYVYLVAGIATAALLRNVIATISGVLLLSAGALVLTMRHNYRTSRKAPEAAAAHETGVRNSSEGAELLQVGWRPGFEVGHEVIDRQHQHLTSLGNQLITALMQGRPSEDIDLMLDVLVTELGKHLKLEEELAAGHGAPLTRSVVEAHRRLLARAAGLRDRFQEGQLPPGDLVGFIAFDLIAMHVVRENPGLLLQQRRPPSADATQQGRRRAVETTGSF